MQLCGIYDLKVTREDVRLNHNTMVLYTIMSFINTFSK